MLMCSRIATVLDIHHWEKNSKTRQRVVEETAPSSPVEGFDAMGNDAAITTTTYVVKHKL